MSLAVVYSTGHRADLGSILTAGVEYTELEATPALYGLSTVWCRRPSWVNSALHPSRVGKSVPSFGLGRDHASVIELLFKSGLQIDILTCNK